MKILEKFLKKMKKKSDIKLSNLFSSESGFSVAEVLLAIVVLGIVAAITIPSLASRKDKREWLTALDKSYNILSNGFKDAEAIHGKAANWGDKFVEYFFDALKNKQVCDEDNSCVPDEVYLNKETYHLPASAKSVVLTDGQILSVEVVDETCSTDLETGGIKGICAYAFIDINGSAKPNSWAKDYFGFYITKNGVEPFGTQKIDVYRENFEYVEQGCNNGIKDCTSNVECEVASQNDEVRCQTCDGQWNVKPAYNTYYSTHTYGCHNYQRCEYWYRHHRCFYDACYGGYFVASTTYHATVHPIEYSCTGVQTYKCMTYKWNDTWSCWMQNGHEFDDACNARSGGTTGDVDKENSCSLKSTDALEDCNLDARGTTCGAWAIYKDNMIYLDSKEVSW